MALGLPVARRYSHGPPGWACRMPKNTTVSAATINTACKDRRAIYVVIPRSTSWPSAGPLPYDTTTGECTAGHPRRTSPVVAQSTAIRPTLGRSLLVPLEDIPLIGRLRRTRLVVANGAVLRRDEAAVVERDLVDAVGDHALPPVIEGEALVQIQR